MIANLEAIAAEPRLYQPNDHVYLSKMCSPASAQSSTAAIIALSLVPSVIHYPPRTPYLDLLVIYPESCRTHCNYLTDLSPEGFNNRHRHGSPGMARESS